jgi:DNA/RNA endonuclease YhcR with UshA esterase domain
MHRRILTTARGVLSVVAIGLCMDHAIADTPTTQVATTGPATTTASAITWDLASKHVGETLTITGPVMGTHVTTGGKSLVLNIGKDFPDPTRFTVMIKTDDKNPASADTYMGKNVTVTGKIELYRKVPEVKVNPADVTIEK